MRRLQVSLLVLLDDAEHERLGNGGVARAVLEAARVGTEFEVHNASVDSVESDADER